VPPRPDANDPTHVRIRRARRDDLAALIDLENGVFSSDRMSARQLRHHLDNPLAEILIAVRAGVAVGAAVLFFRRQHRIARLYSIAVAASARGAGVGLALLVAAERAAKVRGSTLLRLEVRKDNRAAQNLYERQGYRHFGTKDRYYEDGHDAMRFEKVLVRSGGSRPRRIG
jgi:[ribosomal protein S18]-alanine N-acetyltransferase